MAAFSFILGNLAAACAVQIRVSRMCPADIASVCKLRTDIFRRSSCHLEPGTARGG